MFMKTGRKNLGPVLFSPGPAMKLAGMSILSSLIPFALSVSAQALAAPAPVDAPAPPVIAVETPAVTPAPAPPEGAAEGQAPSPATLMKRFERLKERLGRLARERGLLDRSEG